MGLARRNTIPILTVVSPSSTITSLPMPLNEVEERSWPNLLRSMADNYGASIASYLGDRRTNGNNVDRIVQFSLVAGLSIPGNHPQYGSGHARRLRFAGRLSDHLSQKGATKIGRRRYLGKHSQRILLLTPKDVCRSYGVPCVMHAIPNQDSNSPAACR